MLAGDHLVKHGSQLGRPSTRAAVPTPHLLRLLPPRPSPRHTPISTAPESVGVFFSFLLKTKQKSGIQGDLPNQAQGGFHLVSQLSPFLKCCYIKSLQQQKTKQKPKRECKMGLEVGPGEGSKITYSINKLKMNPLLLNQETHNTFISIAHSHFVIRNKSFRSGRGGERGATEIATLYSQLGFRGCTRRRSPLSLFFTPLVS